MFYNKNEVYNLTFQRQWQLFHSEGSERWAENFFLFRSELSLAVNGPHCLVRTLSSIKVTEITAFSGSQKQFDTKLRHFSSQVSVSRYPWPPPRHIATASSASWIRVSEASRKLFSPPDYYFFFHTSWTFCCQQQCPGPWFSSSWGRALKPPNISACYR